MAADEVSQIGTEFALRINDEDALGRILRFCDVHDTNLDIQGLLDGILGGAIVVLPLRDAQERSNAVRVHDTLVQVITDVYPTLYDTVRRISAAYRLAKLLAGD